MSAARKILLLLATMSLATPSPAAQAEPPSVSEEDVSFPAADITLQGTVFAPPADGQRHPAMVLVPGAGPEPSRTQIRSFMAPLTRAGIVALVPHRRTVGYSVTERSYTQLADDTLAAVQVLRARADVDPGRVGLWGASEGAWVTPLAAARSSEISFLVLISASGVPPAQQTAWELTNTLRRDGVSGSMAEHLPVKGVRLVAGLGQFPEADYDTVPALERVRQPVLAVWGAQDHTVPPAESMSIVRNALDRAGNRDYALKVFPGVGHALSRAGDDFENATQVVPEFFDMVDNWVNSHPAGVSVDPPPPEDRASVPVTSDNWYESTWSQAMWLVLFVAAFAGYLGVAGWRKLRHRSTRPPVRWPARVLAVTGLLVPLALLGYVVTVLLTRSAGGVVAGFAVPFLAIRVLAVVALVAAVALAVTWWRRRTEVLGGERVRLGLLLAGGLALVPWTVYWGLLAL